MEENVSKQPEEETTRYHAWLNEGSRTATLIGIAVAVFAFVSFGFVDRLFMPSAEVQMRLLALRGGIVAVLAGQFGVRWVARTGRPGTLCGPALLLTITLGVSSVAAVLGGTATGYHDAVALGMITYGAGVPSRWQPLSVLCIASVAAYFAILALLSKSGIGPLPVAFTQLVILLLAAACAVGTAFLRSRAKCREIQYVIRLEELDTAKNAFFANVNHELRTPLMVVLASLENIRDEIERLSTMVLASHEPIRDEIEHLSSVAVKYVDSAYRNGLRLLAMVDGLLALSRLESSDASALHSNRWALHDFLAQQIDQVRPLARKKEIALSFVSADPVVTVFADREAIGNVVQNLLTNALKFTKPGGSIEVALSLRSGMARVLVTDTGAGIDEKDQPHVFKRFYQGTSGKSTARGGVGIGLSMCQRIVELHEGQIGIVRSKRGEGTSIEFTLPKADSTPVAFDVAEEFGAANTIQEGALPEWDKRLRAQDGYRLAALNEATERRRVERGVDEESKPSILIVDDDADMLEIIKNMVASRFNVHVASDGSEGLEIARRLRPAIVLSDVNMPIMDGFEMLAFLRQDRNLQDVPVVLMTARGGADDRQQASEFQADDFLPKPFTRRRLEPVLERLIKRQTSHVAQVEKASMEAMRLTVSKLAHEIMNPVSFLRKAALTVDRSFKVVLEQVPTPLDAVIQDQAGAHQRSVDVLRSGLLRLTDSIEELKAWAKSQDASLPVAVEITPLVQRAVVLAHEQAEISQILKATSKVALRPGQLERVILNLVLNAIEAGGEGCAITVKTSDDLERRLAIVEVADKGPGIEAGTLEKIFEPHFTTKAAGSGLGLAMCRDIVKQHGGRLEVDSQPGRGTAFKIMLPMVN